MKVHLTLSNCISVMKRKIYIFVLLSLLAVIGFFLICVEAQVVDPTAADELPQIPLTSTSWEEWFFMSRLEIDGQPYMFTDNFARNQPGPNPVVTRNGIIVYLSQGEVTGELTAPFIHSLICPTSGLPSLRSGAPLTPSRLAETSHKCSHNELSHHSRGT